MVRDFAKNIISISARTNKRNLIINQIDKQTWIIEPTIESIEVVYDLYAWDLSVRTAYLDQFRGYFNGSSVFLQVHGFESDVCYIKVCLPEGEKYDKWQIATSLREDNSSNIGNGCYKADGYFDLIDHPVEIGELNFGSFEVCSISHRIVISGLHSADMPRLCADLTKICESQAAMFGELPLDRYLFMVAVVGEGYGGLEHNNSTSLLCNRTDLPKINNNDVSEGYRRFLGLCSHEYFHLWNVKRIRPEAFSKNRLSNEVYTRQLWVFEGITSYYDDLTLIRAGLITVDSYLGLLAQTISRVVRGAGRHKQTLEESSLNAWTKFYKQDENAPNAIVSYYSKGALVALSLDLKIRADTSGSYSLDDVMRAFWLKYGSTGIGVPEDGFELLAEEVSGINLKEFFGSYVRGTQDPPLKKQLLPLGIELDLRQMKDSKDLGGFASSRVKEQKFKAIGVSFTQQTDRVTIRQAFDSGAAQKAGISAGDEFVAINGIKCTPSNVDSFITTCDSYEVLSVHLFRRDELIQFSVEPQMASLDTCDLILFPNTTKEMIEKRDAWLHVNEQ